MSENRTVLETFTVNCSEPGQHHFQIINKITPADMHVRDLDLSDDLLSAELQVTVGDNEPPTWSVPADITVGTDAGASTAVVNYTATATDNVGVTSESCTPASGKYLPLG